MGRNNFAFVFLDAFFRFGTLWNFVIENKVPNGTLAIHSKYRKALYFKFLLKTLSYVDELE